MIGPAQPARRRIREAIAHVIGRVDDRLVARLVDRRTTYVCPAPVAVPGSIRSSSLSTPPLSSLARSTARDIAERVDAAVAHALDRHRRRRAVDVAHLRLGHAAASALAERVVRANLVVIGRLRLDRPVVVFIAAHQAVKRFERPIGRRRAPHRVVRRQARLVPFQRHTALAHPRSQPLRRIRHDRRRLRRLEHLLESALSPIKSCCWMT